MEQLFRCPEGCEGCKVESSGHKVDACLTHDVYTLGNRLGLAFEKMNGPNDDKSSSSVYGSCLFLLLRDLVQPGFGVFYISPLTASCLPLHSRVSAVLIHIPHRAP